PVKHHIPDVLSFEEVVDLFCFCHFFELQGVLCSWQYTVQYSLATVQARRHAIKDRKLARQIKDWFFCHHDLVLHGVPLHPSHAQDLLDHQFLAQQCKALSTFKQRVEADPNSPYLVGESVVSQNQLNVALRECLKGNALALAHFKSPQMALTFNWTHGLQYTVQKKALSFPPSKLTLSPPVDSDIDGLTYNDKKFFQAQNGRLKVKSEPRARSVAISPVDTVVRETTVANTAKRKREVHSDGGDVKYARSSKAASRRRKS
ncbi:hypothetical protein DXG01_010540, partial [Tephrocybe rancida]